MQKYCTENLEVYKQVLLPRRHRGIKFGAKYLVPEQYLASLENGASDAYVFTQAQHSLSVNGRLVSSPTPDQMKYAIMEVQIRWFKVLQGYKSKIKFDEMMGTGDFKTLIDHYGEPDKLLDDYTTGLGFAPDHDLFIRNRIKIFESTLPKYQGSVHAWDRQIKNRIIVQTGEYRRIGYAWVNNGYNANKSDFESITLNNVTLCPEVPVEGKYDIYVNVLYQLACGGAIAFHLAFLRSQLETGTPIRHQRIPVSSPWKGTAEEKDRLFEYLADESFVNRTAINKLNFLNNKAVQWKQDGRLLFYLLDQLRSKKCGMLDRYENLGPLLRNNFLNRAGKSFKNVSQNINGMNNTNKGGRPKLADKIDTLLDKLIDRV